MGDGTVTSHLVQFSPWPTGELPAWKIAGVGDFNGDGDSEIIWQHDSNNLASLWIMDETDVLSVGQFGSAASFRSVLRWCFLWPDFGHESRPLVTSTVTVRMTGCSSSTVMSTCG